MKKIRLFIAVPITGEIREAISRLIRDWRSISGLRWVRSEGIHITLKFLGDMDSDRIPSLKEALDASIAGLQPYSITIQGTGCFPGPKRPRVVWVGIDDSSGLLGQTQKRVDEELFRLNIPKETRKFHPHLTLARVKEGSGIRARLDDFLNHKFGPYPLEVNKILLMRSDLQPSGAIYHCLHTTNFK